MITVYFWIIKILSTGMGEATSDYLAHRFNPILAGVLGTLGLAVALFVQFRLRRYIAWSYWFAVAMVAVFGTMAADGLHYELGIPFFASSAFYFVILILIFWAWYRTERTLSIHSIFTVRREICYWATVLATFALGTAVGDLTATTLQLGFFASGILFVVLFLVPGLSHWLFKLNSVLAFWVAYVLTRPIGASFSDWLGVPKALGGLDWGRGTVALLLAIPMVLLVVYVAITQLDLRDRAPS
ncbi:MAG: COG4705 family protein [Candidatus Dormibacteria bacterium]